MALVFNPFTGRLDFTGSGGSGGGNVTGPSSSTTNDFASFADTSGTLLADSGYSASSFILASGSTITQHDVLVGGSGGTVASVGPGTALQILQSGGGSANPAYSTATYPATTTINQILYSSSANTIAGLATGNNGVLITSSSGVPSLLANGTAGYVLTANSGAPPSWQAAAGGITGTTTQYDVIVGAGTNSVGSVGPGSSGQLLQSGGNAANPAYTTATYPSTATGTGTILRADGTNWSASTSTYPNTNAKGDLLYGSASNVISDLAVSTYYGAPLGNSNSGLPSWNSPRTTVWLYDEFMGNTNGNLGWQLQAVNSGTTNNPSGTSVNPGVIQLSTGVNAAGGYVYYLGIGTGSAGSVILGGGYISIVFYTKIVTLSGSGDTFSINLGFNDAGSSGAVGKGVWFSYTDTVNSGNWVINTNNGSGASGNTANAADTSYHRFRIDIDAAAANCHFYIDDVEVSNSPLSSDIPTTPIKPFFEIIKTGGTNARTYNIDYFSFYQNLTTAR